VLLKISFCFSWFKSLFWSFGIVFWSHILIRLLSWPLKLMVTNHAGYNFIIGSGFCALTRLCAVTHSLICDCVTECNVWLNPNSLWSTNIIIVELAWCLEHVQLKYVFTNLFVTIINLYFVVQIHQNLLNMLTGELINLLMVFSFND